MKRLALTTGVLLAVGWAVAPAFGGGCGDSARDSALYVGGGNSVVILERAIIVGGGHRDYRDRDRSRHIGSSRLLRCLSRADRDRGRRFFSRDGRRLARLRLFYDGRRYRDRDRGGYFYRRSRDSRRTVIINRPIIVQRDSRSCGYRDRSRPRIRIRLKW